MSTMDGGTTKVKGRISVYCDTSALNRIFDDQSQPNIFLESSSMLVIFALIEKRIISILSSEVLTYENSRNPYSERQQFVSSVLQKARVIQTLNAGLAVKAGKMEDMGIKGIDALHLACAEKLNADYFVTCDHRIIRRYAGSTVKVVSPGEFTQRILHEEEENADN